ncbi:MAG: hypothetical protein EU529_00070 [Promethearchaeota archaeon]|nr:MAG: hypothetical protein EU529_00070 [Candidatus Lokiarchaeota archaeon]
MKQNGEKLINNEKKNNNYNNINTVLKMFLEKLKEFPKQKALAIITILSFISFLILTLIMRSIETELKGSTGYGVMEFEFAWTPEMIREIFRAWGVAGKKKEATAIYWDFLYIPSYGLFIAGCILLVTRKLEGGKLQNFGLYITIIPIIAGGFDVIENINLLLMIENDAYIEMGSPFIASLCASIKFGLLFLGICFFIIALIILVINKIRK